jgi:hypothetical protein
MIKTRHLPQSLLEEIKRHDLTYDEFVSAVVIAHLQRNNGIRQHTADRLRIEKRRFIQCLNVAESLGYQVPLRTIGRAKPMTTDNPGVFAFAMNKAWCCDYCRKTSLTQEWYCLKLPAFKICDGNLNDRPEFCPMVELKQCENGTFITFNHKGVK